MRQVVSRVGGAMLAVVVALSGCSLPAGRAPADPRAGQPTLIVGLHAPILTLDPHASVAFNARRFGLFEALVGQQDDGAPEPQLATEWRVVSPTTWRFTLATGRVFHDGSPVTADDVVFSFTRVLNPENRLGVAARIPTVATVRAVDPQTIEIVTRAPDPMLPRRVASVAIVPRAAAQALGPVEFGQRPVGSGPFRLKEFAPTDRLVLTGVSEHPAKPTLRELTLRHVPDPAARVAGLRAGDLDVISQPPLDQTEALRAAGFTVAVMDSGASLDILFNVFAADSPVSDRRVRQALNYAIDKDAIVREVFRGTARVAHGQMVQPEVVGFHPDLQPYSYDPPRARELLAQAGYPNGFAARFDVFISRPEWPTLALTIQQQLRDVGVAVDIITSADTAWYVDRFAGRTPRAPLFSSGFQTAPMLDAAVALEWFRGSQPAASRFYQNAAFDRVYERALIEMDEAARVALLREALAILREDAPLLFLVSAPAVWVSVPSVQGVDRRADQEPRFERVRRAR